MPINESDIAKIAQLAHLEITGEQLSTVDTTNVEPALGGLTPEGSRTDTARDDVVVPSLGQKVALEEAPDAAAGHFRVPKVL